MFAADRAADRAAPAAVPAASITFSSAEALDGRSLMAGPGRVRLPEMGTCILRGTLKNETRTAVTIGLLRMTVENRAIDLQIVRNLGPGESRAFLTSFQRTAGGPPDATQTLIVSFYDIADKTALLLAAKSLQVVF